MSRLLRRPGHVLRRHAQRSRRIYQQTFVDTYTKLAFAKLYDRKTPLMPADLLNDRVIPFFDEHGVTLQRPIVARSTAAHPNVTSTSSAWRSRTSTTAAPKSKVRRPTASSSASIASCLMNFTGSPFDARF